MFVCVVDFSIVAFEPVIMPKVDAIFSDVSSIEIGTFGSIPNSSCCSGVEIFWKHSL